VPSGVGENSPDSSHFVTWVRWASISGHVAWRLLASASSGNHSALKADHADQDVTKAETIAACLKLLGFQGFAAGKNDWAGGDAELGKLTITSGGVLLGEHAPDHGALVTGGGRHGVLCQLLDQVGEEQILVRPAAVDGAAGHSGLPDQLLKADVVEADGQAGTGQGLKRGVQQASPGLLFADAPGTPTQAARGRSRTVGGTLGIRSFKFDTLKLS